MAVGALLTSVTVTKTVPVALSGGAPLSVLKQYIESQTEVE